MLTTDFEDILREAAEETTLLDPNNLPSDGFKSLRRSAKRRLEQAWEYHFWPELGRVEQRFYREPWNGTDTYAAIDETFYVPTQKYYLALRSVPANTPPADSNGDVDPDYWAESDVSYSAEDYDAAASYEQQDRVSYGGEVYQLFDTGPVTGVLPTDTTKWGRLVPFDRYVAYEQADETAIGIVRGAFSRNPRVSTRGVELSWTLSNNGVQVQTPSTFAWLDFRIRCPQLTGDVFDSTAVYAAGRQVYFSSDATPGNFYTATTTTTAGDSPDSAPEKWSVVEVPRLFHKYLVLAIASDWVSGPGGGEAEDWARLGALAEGALQDQKSLLVGQQSQREKTTVQTR